MSYVPGGFLDRVQKRKDATHPAPAPDTMPAAPVGTRNDRYVTAALRQQTDTVLAAANGTRNHTLNAAAYSLGRLVHAGLTEQTITDTLTEAALTAGLDPTETARTIASGLTSGQTQPRPVPAGSDWANVTTLITPQPDPDGSDMIAPADPAELLDRQVREKLPTLDWHALWADEDEDEWIVEPLLPARRLVAVYSAPKLGKSLLMLEIAVAVVTGRPVLGTRIDRPRNVLYVDFENDPKADIRDRLQAMGVGPDDLTRLHYLSFPTLAALDSDQGGRELMAAVTVYGCEVVVIDTVSRAVAGEENENDTWLAFYRHTGLRLKQAGVALVRLDHTGKDEGRGQRGASAKSGDVDAVWRLSRITETSLRLDCEANRMPVAEKTLVLHRELVPHLRHRVDAEGRSAAFRIKVDAVVGLLDAAGLAADAGRTAARETVRTTGIRASNAIIAEAIRRRSRAVPDWRGPHPFEERSPTPADRPGPQEDK